MDRHGSRYIDMNLSTKTISFKTIDEETLKLFLGGVGLSSKIVFEETEPNIYPYDKDNILCFSVGVFAGTNIPTACRTEATSKSPLTGLIGTSNSGNYWGAELKYAGYEGIIIRGKSEKPVYVFINDDSIQFLDADFIWGKNTWETMDLLKKELKDNEIQIASIGQAGENLVRYASIQNGYFDAWGRTGLGAVMGSKNLKAIVVRGTKGIYVNDEKEFLKLSEQTRLEIEKSPFFEPFKKYGTMLATIPYYNFGALPGRNFQTSKLDGWIENRSRKVVEKYSDRSISCLSCPIACAHWVEIKNGKYEGLKIKDMEVTPVIGFAAGCDIDNIPAVAKMSELCQKFGIDMVSTASSIAFAMELFQRNLISEEQIGFALEWGNEDAVIKMIELISLRSGLGDVLAEGTKIAEEKLLKTNLYAMHIKGLEIPMADPRGRWSTWTFGNLTNIRGGDHLRNRNPVENLKYNDNPIPYKTEKFEFDNDMFENLDIPGKIKNEIFDEKTRDVNIAKMSKWSEDLISVYNCVGLCIRPPVLQAIGPGMIAGLYKTFTGIDITSEEIMKAGERTWNIQKLFNIREGEQKKDSVFPDRFYDDFQDNGMGKEKKLDRKKVMETLDDYYEYRGWDVLTGEPTIEKLLDLNLK